MVTLLAPPAVRTFNSHLAKPMVIDARSGGKYTLMAVQTSADLGLGVIDPVTGLPVKTSIYAYQLANPDTASMIGGHTHTATDVVYNPTFLVSSGTPIQMSWMNMLPATGGHLLPLDGSILMSMGGAGTMPVDPNMIPIVTHLHGGHVAWIYDGYPSSTLSQDAMNSGMVMTPGMAMPSTTTYTYDNSQPSAMLWYHDHSLGYTRLNVYAGLAGQYFIEDQNRRDLVTAGILPETLGLHETNLTIADRSFTSEGQLYYPGASASDPLPGTTDLVGDVLPPDYEALGGTFPTAVPEYFGDFILVNGTAWPHAHVAQGQEMFDLLNGSDSRFYTFKLDNPWVKVTIIGTDGGLLPKPITVFNGDGIDGPGEQITLAPGDRLQLMFDFSNVPVGEKVHLLNVGAAFEPFKGLTSEGALSPGYDDLGNPVPVVAATAADSVGQVLEFRVNAATPWHSAMTDDTVLNPDYITLDPATAAVTRKLGVFETTDQYGRIMPMIGTAEARPDFNGITHLGGLGWDAPVTEFVKLGDTEIWEFYNTTADAHPMHIHLGEYQVLGRYTISATDTNGDGVMIDGYNNDLGDLIDTRADLPGIQNLYPEDTGNQDTVWVGPGEVLRVIAKFDRPGSYVWHCHILSHEDHDMMRPLTVLGIAGDFAGLITEDASSAALGLVELGKADFSKQGFVCGDLTGSANLGVLHLANNLILTNGAKVDGNNGEWSYTTSAAAQALAEGESVVDKVTISELDGTTHVISVTVVGINDAPIVSGTVALSGAQNVAQMITSAQLLALASDIDHGARLTVSGLTASAGLLQDNGDGTWTFNPDVNAQGAVQLSYNVSDGMAQTAGNATLSLAAGAAFNVMNGTGLVNKLAGTNLNDYMSGFAGNDELKGANGNDVLDGGTGNDQLSGGNGNDVFIGQIGDGNDELVGGSGIDTYDLSRTSAAATVNLRTGSATGAEIGTDRINEIENLIGGRGNDRFTGNDLANLLNGGVGDDTLDGSGGNDTLIGGSGNDRMTGGAGNDVFSFAYDSPSFAYNFGHDIITDFTAGSTATKPHDVIDLRGLGFTSFTDVISHIDGGPNAVLHVGANDITFMGVQVSQLHAWDFMI